MPSKKAEELKIGKEGGKKFQRMAFCNYHGAVTLLLSRCTQMTMLY